MHLKTCHEHPPLIGTGYLADCRLISIQIIEVCMGHFEVYQ
jgi:hypothetical protein